MNQSKKNNIKIKIVRTLIVILCLTAIVVLSYFLLVWTGAWEYVNSVEKIRQLILSMGFWGRFVFVALQFLQVTLLPIPSTISTLAGVLIYGPLQASLLSLSGIVLGSVFAFFLGRTFGKRIVMFIVGAQTCEKWRKFLSGAKYSFVLMMFLPIVALNSFFSWPLVVFSFALWLVWEICVFVYPERFWEKSNEALKCSNCTDKLCTQYCQKLRR